MDVTTVLREQHAGIRRAFVRAALPGPNRAGEFRRLVRMLAEHEAAEEAHVHPAVRQVGRERVAAARAGEEERAKRLLARLWQGGPHGRGYLILLSQLGWQVLRHAAREEREEFPVLDGLGPAKRRVLAAEVYWPGNWRRPGRTRGSTVNSGTSWRCRCSAPRTGSATSPPGCVTLAAGHEAGRLRPDRRVRGDRRRPAGRPGGGRSGLEVNPEEGRGR